MTIEITEVPNEALGDALVKLYGFKVGVLFDNIVTGIMRKNMVHEADRNQGFGMCDAYQLSAENHEGEQIQCIFLVWRGDEKIEAAGPENFYQGQATLTELSLAANLIAFSHLSFQTPAPYNEVLGQSFHLLQQHLYSGNSEFEEQIPEIVKIID